jgi:hypothetical protein
MAPNVKENLIDKLDLSNHRLDFLNNKLPTQLPKYLPLTSDFHASEEVAADTTNYKATHYEGEEDASYWDWEQPTDEEEKAKLIEKILKEEECRQAVSTDNIVANLIADSQKTSTGKTTTVYGEETQEEGYWDMPAPENDCGVPEEDMFSVAHLEKLLIAQFSKSEGKAMVEAPHVHDKSHPANSYWDWPSAPITSQEKKEALLDQILKEESIRVLLSIGTIEQQLKQQSSSCASPSSSSTESVTNPNNMEDKYWYWESKTQEVAAHVLDASHPNHEYWDFPSKPATEEEHKAALIQKILKEESIRQLLTSTHMEANETRQKPQSSIETISSPHVDDAYWRWNHDDVTIAPHAKDHTHPSNSYWDFPSAPITKEEKKAALIARILEEESIRQTLCVSHIEKKLSENKCEKIIHSQDEKEESVLYWDW